MERVVVLPAPLGPTSPMKRPAGSVRSMPLTAICSPNFFHRPWTRTAGGTATPPPGAAAGPPGEAAVVCCGGADSAR